MGSNSFTWFKGSLRRKVLAYVVPMVLLSLLSSAYSLFRMTEVSRFLEAINHISVPLGRLITQVQSDAEIFTRELDRNLGYHHWKDPQWRPHKVPRWIESVLENEISHISELVGSSYDWADQDSREFWRSWATLAQEKIRTLSSLSLSLFNALETRNSFDFRNGLDLKSDTKLEMGVRPDFKTDSQATEIYNKWAISIDDWKRHLQSGVIEYDHSLRQSFGIAESRFIELRTGLEVILVVVVLMSLLLLWLGERALRPLEELTRLARDIARRGLRKEDKSLLPDIPLSRSDEVSQLAREFHHMATALLEREKTVEAQKSRLQEQNRLLREMGQLNQNILNSIDSVLLVVDLDGRITQCNPQAIQWLGSSEDKIKGSELSSWQKLQFVSQQMKISAEACRLNPVEIESRVIGGHVMPLRGDLRGDPGQVPGAIIVLDDLTEELDLQERLRRAENLAAIGRMSAQVAHEVRNPLHSIGLEAEMAAELANRLGDATLRQSLYSILNSVDRLQKITENYLKLSRLSTGQKQMVNLGQLIESVIHTYSTACEAQGVQIVLKVDENANLNILADPDLMEQVLGNLLRNALQAIENQSEAPRISWLLENTAHHQIRLRIADTGPGIPTEIKTKLFTPFVTSRAQGTGLGLSFVKKVVEDHKGTVRNVELPPEVASKQTTGACFEILLPVVEPALEKIVLPENKPENRKGTQEVIHHV